MGVICITRGATEPVLGLIHGEAGGRGNAGGRGMITDAVGVWNEGRLSGLTVSIGIALRTERSTKLLES